MIKVMKEYSLRGPDFDINENWFTIIFKRPEITIQKTREKTREKIISIIRDRPQVSSDELAREIGISVKGIEWNLAKLKSEGRLKRVGPDKGGYWEVKK